jgi:hypothetical protein
VVIDAGRVLMLLGGWDVLDGGRLLLVVILTLLGVLT